MPGPSVVFYDHAAAYWQWQWYMQALAADADMRRSGSGDEIRELVLFSGGYPKTRERLSLLAQEARHIHSFLPEIETPW